MANYSVVVWYMLNALEFYIDLAIRFINCNDNASIIRYFKGVEGEVLVIVEIC